VYRESDKSKIIGIPGMKGGNVHTIVSYIAASMHGATRALFTLHYGPPRVIAIMKFKPHRLCSMRKCIFATINSLAGMQRDLNAAQLNERNATRGSKV